MNNQSVELSYFSGALIRRWHLPLGLAVIGALIGLQLRAEVGPTMYEAETRLLIRPVTDSVFDSNIRVDQIINEDTEAQLAASELVVVNALELLGTDASDGLSPATIEEALSVKIRSDSQIVVIRFRHQDPDTAGAVADAVASAYLSHRSSTAVAEMDRQVNQFAAQISDLTRDLTIANVTIATGASEQQARRLLEQRIAKLEEVVAIAALQGEPSAVVGDPIGDLVAELSALETTVDPVALAAANTSAELITEQISNLREELLTLLTIEIDGGESIQTAARGEALLPPNDLVRPAIGSLVGLFLGLVLAVIVNRSVIAKTTSATATVGGDAQNPPDVGNQRSDAGTATTDPITETQPIHEHESSLKATEFKGSEPIFDADNEPAVVEAGRFTAPRPVQGRDARSGLHTNAHQSAGSTTSANNTVVSLADIEKIPRSATQPIVVTAPRSEAALALRRVARVIQNDAADLTTPSILITSAREHEGKSTVAMNLAAALRQDGMSVLLITDAHAETTVPGVHVLPPGMQLGPELVFPDTDRLKQLLAEARDLVDVVLIDGPAVLTNPEASRLASVTDHAVLVAVSSKTSASDVSASVAMLEESGTTLFGLVTTSRPSWLVRRVTGPDTAIS